MLKCTLSRHKSYQVQNIFLNKAENSYQLTLTEKPPGCESGIFSSKKLELKVVPDNKIPFLHFNKQDRVPELVLSNLSLVKSEQVKYESSTTIAEGLTPVQNSAPHFSFLYILLGVVVLIMLIRFILKKRNSTPPYYPSNMNPNDMNQNNILNGNNNNPNNQYNNGQMTQPPSRTSSLLTGLAGGVAGSIVGNALYDKFKGSSEAQAAQNPHTPLDSNDTFSSDSDESSDIDDSFSSDD